MVVGPDGDAAERAVEEVEQEAEDQTHSCAWVQMQVEVQGEVDIAMMDNRS